MNDNEYTDAWVNPLPGSERWYEQYGAWNDVDFEPWKTLFSLGVVTRLPCVAWALVAPLRIGSLDYVLPLLTARLKLDYDDEGVVEILRWWSACHGSTEPSEGWASFVASTPTVGNPCIRSESVTTDNGHRIRSCLVLSNEYMQRESDPFQPQCDESHCEGCTYTCLYDGLVRLEDEFGVLHILMSPMPTLIATREFYSLSEREMKLYAFISDGLRRLTTDFRELPMFPFLTASYDDIRRVTKMSDPKDPAKSLVAKGLIERKPPEKREDAYQYRLVTPAPHRHHDDALKGLAERWALMSDGAGDVQANTRDAAVAPDSECHCAAPSIEPDVAQDVVAIPAQPSATGRSGLAVATLLEVAGELPAAAVATLGQAGISAEVAERYGIRYLPTEKVEELEKRLRAIGFTDAEQKICGMRSTKNLVFSATKPKPFFLPVRNDDNSEAILAFSVTPSGTCATARTHVSCRLNFGADCAAAAKEFVLCKNFAEALVVESTGFRGVSCGFDSTKNFGRLPGDFRNRRPWAGKHVLVSWSEGDDPKDKGRIVFTGALSKHMSTPLAQLLSRGENVGEALEADFAAMRPQSSGSAQTARIAR